MWIVIHMGVVPVHYRCTTVSTWECYRCTTVATPSYYRQITVATVVPSSTLGGGCMVLPSTLP